jgi:serine phosphatase RsbU (regulator of sigma subunit)
MLYTDGLIEGRIGQGSERLGSERLMDLIRDALRGPRPAALDRERLAGLDGGRPADDQLLDQVIAQVRELNGKDLDDDLAVLALSFSAQDGR